MKNKLMNREMNPLDPNEFLLLQDSMCISNDMINEIKRDGNKYAVLFGDGIDLFSLVEQALVLPVGRCKQTNEILYETTEKGKIVLQTHRDLQEKTFTMGLAKRISDKIKSGLGLGLILLTFISCAKSGVEVNKVSNPEIEITKLFTHESCTVNRFFDNGEYIYFSNCHLVRH